MKNRHRYYSPEYQRVIIAVSHGVFEDGSRWVSDTSGIVYRAESFVPFPGNGNF
jgi:hypothetical protein